MVLSVRLMGWVWRVADRVTQIAEPRLAPPASRAGAAHCAHEQGELFLTHGHVFGAGMHNSVDHAPALPEGSALVYGHTHIKVNEASEEHPGLWLFNPGSVSIPKDGTHSYGRSLRGPW